MKRSPKGGRLLRIKYTDDDEVRQTPEKSVRDEERSPFERDRSRIIHSAAFRRLQGKTQVITVGEGDFLRTRLTHSLEVAQIGKGVALRLGANTDSVEAISLVHDIGHPPFGHAGEQELKSLMKSYGGFEANAQNIRVLTELETKSNDYSGLNLTRAVIDGQMKYKDTFNGKRKKFIYCEDTEVMEWAGDKAESVSPLSHKGAKSFECQIMDWADDVAYAVHDLEDSIHTGYISYASLQDQHRGGEVIKRVICEFEDCSIDVSEVCESFVTILRRTFPPFQGLYAVNGRQRQKAYRKQLASFLINRFIKATQRVESVTIPKDQLSYRYWYRVYIPIQPGFPILGVFRLNGQPKRDGSIIVRSCKATQSPVYPIRDAILAVNHASCPSLSSSGPRQWGESALKTSRLLGALSLLARSWLYPPSAWRRR